MASHMQFLSKIKRSMLLKRGKGSWGGIINKECIRRMESSKYSGSSLAELG